MNVKAAFQCAEDRGYRHVKSDTYESSEKSHGRNEHRICRVLSTEQARKIHWLDIGGNWPKLSSIARVTYSHATQENASITETRYYISSLKVDAEKIANSVRSHWQVENKLHWSLDVTFKEDASRMRKEHSPENFSTLRRFALNILRADPYKRSLKIKRKKCAINLGYMSKVITNQHLVSF